MDARTRRIARLVDWATGHGATLHPSAEVYHDARTGLSFRVKPDADAEIRPWEPIVSLPSALALSYLNARPDTSQRPFSESFVTQTPAHVVGRLFLVQQYLLGEESFWWPYIQALPQPEDRDDWALPPFWPAEDAELLDGTNVEVGIEKIKADVKREFMDAMRVLAGSEPGDGDAAAFRRPVSMELYQWAYCIFSSRSFRPSLVLSEIEQASLPARVGIDDFSALLPLFDIGNHDMTADVRWHLRPDGKSCELLVGREHGPGEQIFNNYSMKTNAELLLGYGFMIPTTEELHNDYTHVRKRTGEPTASEEYFISLRPMDHPSSVLGRFKRTFRLAEPASMLGAFQHVQPDMVWDIFCTLTQPAQRAQLIPLPNEPAKGEGEDETGTAADRERRERFFAGRVGEECRTYLEQTVAIIQHKVLQELERLDETDVEIAAGDDADLTTNQRLALEYRERCRRVLENTLESISLDDELLQEAEAEAQ